MSVILRMAVREMRSRTGRYLFFVLSVAVGVAALVGVKGFATGLEAAMLREARTLMAGDLQFSQSVPPTDRQVAAIAELPDRFGARVTPVIEMVTMVAAANGTGTVLAELKAVDPGAYPFYGAVETDPPGQLAALLRPDTVLVAPDLLPRLGISPGDSVQIGRSTFTVAGAVVREPDRIVSGLAIGPRVLLHHDALPATGLVARGSRISHQWLIQLPPDQDPEPVRQFLAAAEPDREPRIRDFRQAQPQVRRFLGHLTTFLSLVSVVALLVGGLGVAHTTRAFVRQKMDTIATLRCLGATPRAVLGIYLAQSLLLGLAGSLLGVLGGLAVQAALPPLLAPLFRLDAAITPSPTAVLQGILAGLLVTALFALVPLAGIGRIPAALVFRRDLAEGGGAGGSLNRTEWQAVALAAVGLGLLAAWQAGSLTWTLYFLGGLAGAAAVLGAAGWLLLAGLRRLPRPGGLAVRHGLAGLHRPGSQAVAVMLALGLGVTAVTAVFLIQQAIVGQVQRSTPAGTPTLFLIGIQTGEQKDLAAFLDAHPAVGSVEEMVPMVPARLAGVRGEALDADRLPEDQRWLARRQFRLTWSAAPPAGNTVIAGRWWTPADYADRPLISVEEEVARDLNLHIGDTMTFEIDGLPVTATIHNLRRADWQRVGTNFFVVFSPGALDGFSTEYVALVHSDPGGEPQLLRALVARFPGVTAINVRDVLATVQDVMDRIALVVRFIATFAIAGGLIILGGSVAATKFRRLREAAVLRALGGSRGLVGRILLVEYLSLGLAAGLVGSLVAHAIAGAALSFLFDITPTLQPAVLVAGPALTALLTAAVGWAASADILWQQPLAVLRND